MVCAKTTVLHESGLHMRPAQEFVSAVANYPCKVTIKVGDKSVNGKSILSVMGRLSRVNAQKSKNNFTRPE